MKTVSVFHRVVVGTRKWPRSWYREELTAFSQSTRYPPGGSIIKLEEFTSVFSVVLPPGKISVTIPAEFIDLGDEFKYEVLAREESFNQTAVESCFVLEEKED